MNQIVLDLETQKGFDDVGGRDNLVALGVSLVGIYRYDQSGYESYLEPELTRLETVLSQALRIVGFNIKRFDFPVLQPYFKNLKLSELQTLDLLEEVEKAIGHRVSLQTLAEATLGEGKSGNGLDAIEYFRQQDWDRLKKYCLDDVRLTMELYEFGKKFGRLYFLSKDRTTKIEIPISWKDPVPPSNLSLF
ncbi:MAG: ribonuclease H-like domain-containing protein [Deltaproteobacteria bacterium]|nr:ribonuclease H-like domain-containing protein [Deltaproteobacteria bacterium]MBI4374052.1 ribonuclease H-like domain-containing protein [Deltaproteobacteria bacterium]